MTTDPTTTDLDVTALVPDMTGLAAALGVTATIDPATTLLAVTSDVYGLSWLRDLGTGARICLGDYSRDGVDRLQMLAGMLVEELDAADPTTSHVLEEYDIGEPADDEEDDEDV